MKRARFSSGSVVFDKARGTWRFLQWVDGKRKSQTLGTTRELPTKAAAWQQASKLALSKPKQATEITMAELATRFEAERFPSRHDTAQVYRSWLKNHIIPSWGDQPLSTIQPLPVELWLRKLALSPKSKTHVRSLMHSLFEFAMFAGVIELGRNPISLVRNTGASQKTRQTRSLAVAEFQRLVQKLPEPFATMALCCACLGLRISEALGLKWGDVD